MEVNPVRFWGRVAFCVAGPAIIDAEGLACAGAASPVVYLDFPRIVRRSASLRPHTVDAPPLINRAQVSPALREARRSKKGSTDELWRHLIACPVIGYRSSRVTIET